MGYFNHKNWGSKLSDTVSIKQLKAAKDNKVYTTVLWSRDPPFYSVPIRIKYKIAMGGYTVKR